MNTSLASSSELRLFIIGFIGLLIFMVVISNSFPNEASQPVKQAQQMDSRDGHPNYMTKPDEATAKVNALVKSTQGEYKRLSDAEKSWLDAMTSGHGYDMFVGRAKTLLKKSKSKAISNESKTVKVQK